VSEKLASIETELALVDNANDANHEENIFITAVIKELKTPSGSETSRPPFCKDADNFRKLVTNVTLMEAARPGMTKVEDLAFPSFDFKLNPANFTDVYKFEKFNQEACRHQVAGRLAGVYKEALGVLKNNFEKAKKNEDARLVKVLAALR